MTKKELEAQERKAAKRERDRIYRANKRAADMAELQRFADARDKGAA